ncbi:hypothetical protein D915_009753 [Fasciola hepatica]|uniref:Uncharacterized protein n=1 Tax=Fasciola hepatica TaxID=6192 RepID=A0A4E0QYQ6_FASHE|nr:hypothetical protein D915_009753 [Fasciola hepatica]
MTMLFHVFSCPRKRQRQSGRWTRERKRGALISGIRRFRARPSHCSRWRWNSDSSSISRQLCLTFRMRRRHPWSTLYSFLISSTRSGYLSQSSVNIGRTAIQKM